MIARHSPFARGDQQTIDGQLAGSWWRGLPFLTKALKQQPGAGERLFDDLSANQDCFA
jgi:hypothetical protein